jgi:Uma2 family endonuclease
MAIPQEYLPHYTYEDYAQWEGRWELIEGMPYAMSPAPGLKHQRVNGNLHNLFHQALSNCRQCVVYLPIDWKIDESTVVQPDLSVVCDGSSGNYIETPPVLVAEILSPSTAQKDRHIKYDIYRQQGVKYYLIIDPEREQVQVYEREAGNFVERPQAGHYIFELQQCRADIRFDDLW